MLYFTRGYRLTRNFDAAEDSLVDEHASSCPELLPPGRRISSCRHMNESPDDRGALQRVDNRPGTAKSGAKKTRGGRSPGGADPVSAKRATTALWCFDSLRARTLTLACMSVAVGPVGPW